MLIVPTVCLSIIAPGVESALKYPCPEICVCVKKRREKTETLKRQESKKNKKCSSMHEERYLKRARDTQSSSTKKYHRIPFTHLLSSSSFCYSYLAMMENLPYPSVTVNVFYCVLSFHSDHYEGSFSSYEGGSVVPFTDGLGVIV